MTGSKCRNSVFCVQFLLFFLIGTICGIWFYRCMLQADGGWLETYCGMLTAGPVWSWLFSCLRPLVLAALLWLHPFGHRVIPLLIAWRGALTSYTACAVLRSGLSSGLLLIRGLLLLPVFYWLCRQAYGRKETVSAVSGREMFVTRKKVWFMC